MRINDQKIPRLLIPKIPKPQKIINKNNNNNNNYTSLYSSYVNNLITRNSSYIKDLSHSHIDYTLPVITPLKLNNSYSDVKPSNQIIFSKKKSITRNPCKLYYLLLVTRIKDYYLGESVLKFNPIARPQSSYDFPIKKKGKKTYQFN